MGQFDFDTRTPEEIAAENKARFCLRLQIAPSEYDNLTMREINAFWKEAEKIAKESKSK